MSIAVSDKIRKYKVSIFGESYNLASDESEEHISEVVQLVDNCMRDMSSKNSVVDPKRVAVLVALQCASKAVASRKMVEHASAETDRIIDLINRELVL